MQLSYGEAGMRLGVQLNMGNVAGQEGGGRRDARREEKRGAEGSEHS